MGGVGGGGGDGGEGVVEVVLLVGKVLVKVVNSLFFVEW